MKKQKNAGLILLNLAYVLALTAVVTPLLILANYNYPSADDWSYGEAIYHVLRGGGSVPEMIKAVWESVRYNYFNWEGRFSNALLASLQPGIWGEQYYSLTTWLMLGGIVGAEVLLARFCIGGGKKENRWLYLPVVLPALILQILYAPYPEESFYWYTGAVNYTFMFALSLVVSVLFLRLAGNGEAKKWKKMIMAVAAVLLAVLVGGDNFATSLSLLLTLICLSVLFWFGDKGALKRTWFITFSLAAALLASIFAPANAVRVSANFGGETKSALGAVVNSIIRSCTNIFSWTDAKMIFLLILVAPFLWRAVKNLECEFKFPGIFTVLTFGIYASQCTATMYVDGTTGGGRMADILYYSYYVWIIGNLWYWLGWLCRKYGQRLSTLKEKSGRNFGGLVWIGAAAALCLVGAGDMKELTFYKAYRNLRQGFAKQYAIEWETRLEILRDESVDKVEVAPLSVLPEMLLYTDLQYKDGYYWVNEACAGYYGKESVDLLPKE